MSAQTFVDRIAGKRTEQAPKPSDDLALTSLGTLLSEPDDAVEWLIDGLICVQLREYARRQTEGGQIPTSPDRWRSALRPARPLSAGRC